MAKARGLEGSADERESVSGERNAVGKMGNVCERCGNLMEKSVVVDVVDAGQKLTWRQ
jgi:hypothetical protein